MRRLACLLVLAGCSGEAPRDQDAGERLEQAAVAAGLVAGEDAAITGYWAREGDRMCVVPDAADPGGERLRVGLVVDYGEGNACVASGTVERSGDRLDLSFGEGCRVRARVADGRISLPADVGEDCAHRCRGNASLSALVVDKTSDSLGEARALRSPSGVPLCD